LRLPLPEAAGHAGRLGGQPHVTERPGGGHRADPAETGEDERAGVAELFEVEAELAERDVARPRDALPLELPGVADVDPGAAGAGRVAPPGGLRRRLLLLPGREAEPLSGAAARRDRPAVLGEDGVLLQVRREHGVDVRRVPRSL